MFVQFELLQTIFFNLANFNMCLKYTHKKKKIQ